MGGGGHRGGAPPEVSQCERPVCGAGLRGHVAATTGAMAAALGAGARAGDGSSTLPTRQAKPYSTATPGPMPLRVGSNIELAPFWGPGWTAVPLWLAGNGALGWPLQSLALPLSKLATRHSLLSKYTRAAVFVRKNRKITKITVCDGQGVPRRDAKMECGSRPSVFIGSRSHLARFERP